MSVATPPTAIPEDDERKIDWAGLARTYRAFGRHYAPYRGVLAISYASLFATIAITALKPWPLKLILDHVVLGRALPHRFGALAHALDGRPVALLAVLALGIVAIAALEAVFSYVNKFWISGTGDRIGADIRERVFGHLQRLSLSFHESARSGNLVYLLVSDTRQMKNLLVDFPQDLTLRVVSFLLFAGLMLALDLRLGLIALAAVVPIALCTRIFGRGMKEATRELRAREGEIASIVGENVSAMAVVQAYGQEARELERFEAGNRESLEAQRRLVRLHRTYGRLVDLFVTLSTAGVLFDGGRRALAGDILPGTLIVFVAYIRELYGSFDRFSAVFMSLARSQACGERLVELVENDLVAEDAPDAAAAPPLAGRVEFRDVTFAYKRGRPVLEKLRFVAEPGETIAIVGHSGAGKSTLLSLLLRFYDPQEGAVLLDGHDARSFTRRSLREQMTVVLQGARLFRRSVTENIGFGRRDATDDEIVEAARLAEAHEFVSRLPDGYATVLTEEGGDLSGGERQRIHIARALLRRTPIVVLDEPSAGIDQAAEARIQAATRRLTRGRTTFVIAHRMATLMHADRVLVLEAGAPAAQGTHTELLRTCAAYREFCGLQLGRPLPAVNGTAHAAAG